ncbi:aldose 1-epimerase [Ralstonia wenshanensis]|uniref:aldose 1-epimerase n=1 Tax=Ralstonia wenshanensis TaxID=2842456 RepID=UPI002AAEFB84|nr:aldose 1-epimerase [Ralstonia wenshanensis]MDY7511464.1 aldose 1-epimerase [Ralstonia wenshanensis]
MPSEIQCPPRCIAIADRDWCVSICPEIGGAIVTATWRGRPIFHDRSAEALDSLNVRRMGCYPLVPYSNRIGHACFEWEGTTQTLRPNFPGEPHAIHGFGWQRAWGVEWATDTTVALTLRHSPDADWPYACSIRQTLSLNEASLALTLEMTNEHSTPVPAGLGWHPFFPMSTATRLQTRWERMLDMDPDHLPYQDIPVPLRFNFAHGQPMSDIEVDHCFAGWRGSATIRQDDYVVDLQSAGTPAAVLMRQHGQGFFALEPVSHVNNALQFAPSRALGPMHALAAGHTMRIAMRLAVQALEPDTY